ncbi:16333_t:CDS:2, partial [Funneliformis geosporum]
RLMSDWFIVDKSIKPEDENEGLIEILLICANAFLLYASSNYLIHLGENISSVYLNKHIPKRKVEEILPYDANFRKELLSLYQNMGYVSALLESSYQHYELASFLQELKVFA